MLYLLRGLKEWSGLIAVAIAAASFAFAYSTQGNDAYQKINFYLGKANKIVFTSLKICSSASNGNKDISSCEAALQRSKRQLENVVGAFKLYSPQLSINQFVDASSAIQDLKISIGRMELWVFAMKWSNFIGQ